MCIQPMKKDQDIQKNVRDILTFYAMPRRYTRRSTPVLAGQGAAAAAKLSHDETKGNSGKVSSAGCHTGPGCIFTAWAKSV